MNWNDLESFAEYDRELPCPNCNQPANPTVAAGNWKCNPCGHLFREDGTKPTMECTCLKCNPLHDPLKGKTKGKKAELQLPEKKSKKKKGTTKMKKPLLNWNNIEEIWDYDCKNDLEDDSSLYNKLCQQSKPSDYYFAILAIDTWGDGNKTTHVLLVPKQYYDEKNLWWDQHLGTIPKFPADFHDINACQYETERPLKVVKDELIKIGFIFNTQIQKDWKETVDPSEAEKE